LDPYNVPEKKPPECRLVECLITENNIRELKAARISKAQMIYKQKIK